MPSEPMADEQAKHLRWISADAGVWAPVTDENKRRMVRSLLDERDRLNKAVSFARSLNAQLSSDIGELKAERDRLRTEVACMGCRIEILEGKVE